MVPVEVGQVRTPLDGLDPRAVAQLNFPDVPKKKARRKYLKGVTEDVRGCTGCGLRGANNDASPVPFRVDASITPRMVVVGGAPSGKEVQRGDVFTDDLGRQLKAMFKDAGLDYDDALYCNVVSCMPTDDGSKMRMPKKPEIKACRGNLMAQVEAGYTPYVLLVGGAALDAFRSDLTLVAHHGHAFIWLDSYLVMPISSPGSTEFRGQDATREIVADLKWWKKIVDSEDDPTQFLDDDCAWCSEWATMWDRDGVAFCEKHWAKKGYQWKAERERFVDSGIEQLTF